MKTCVLLHRGLLLSSTFVACLFPGRSALAQSVGSGEPLPGLERMESSSSTDSVAYTFEGFVLAPDGTRAGGAVVASSTGGRTVTDANGVFRLEARVALAARAVQITAAGRAGEDGFASQQVPLSTGSGRVWVGPLALAQGSTCTPDWLPTFGETPGTDDAVRCMTAFDDGGGAALYIGGNFSFAGGAFARGIAKWDGSSWAPVGSGVSGDVACMTVFDDGTGAALYAGWDSGVTKWNGSGWMPLSFGVNEDVYALAVFDDGGGAALYAGGRFASLGGVAVNRIAKWNGSSWAPLGAGVDGMVTALEVFDDGGGPALYAGGNFASAGGVPAQGIARWDGSSWAPLGMGVGMGVSNFVLDMAVFDDGGGDALHVTGSFTTAGGAAAPHIAKWDGSSWALLGSGTNDDGFALTVFDDGGGAALYAGGQFTTAGGVAVQHIAKWDGSSWTPLGAGMSNGVGVSTLTGFDDGGGAALYAGGSFTTAGGVSALRIAKWDGSSWAALGTGMNSSTDALTVFDGGGGPALYAGGGFTSAGGVPVNRIARWNGTGWAPLDSGMNGPVGALAAFDDGSGAALYAAGDFTTAGGMAANHVAKWDGSSWAALGSGLDRLANALTVFDDGNGPALYVGGTFLIAGSAGASRVARWDGSSWAPLGGGVNKVVRALTVFDDGGGAALYAGGDFWNADGASVNGIAKWDGSSWTPLGTGIRHQGVRALAVFDDGGGPALYAGGGFTTAGGVAANHVAKWDGSSWTPLGSGMNQHVFSLTVFDDGGGPALYAGGGFSVAGGVLARGIAKWDGSSWAALGSGVMGVMNGAVSDLEVFDDGEGEALYAGGSFVSSDSTDSYLAKWGCPVVSLPSFCDASDGSHAACPCSNPGNPDAGCDNPPGTGGVALTIVAQTTSANGATLQGTGFPAMASPTAMLIRSDSLDPLSPVVFGDGLRCVNSTPLVRLAPTTASSGVSTHTFGHGSMAGQGTFYYQIWYRSLPSTYCTSDAFNLSNGRALTW